MGTNIRWWHPLVENKKFFLLFTARNNLLSYICPSFIKLLADEIDSADVRFEDQAQTLWMTSRVKPVKFLKPNQRTKLPTMAKLPIERLRTGA
jgi:hypothetical protein